MRYYGGVLGRTASRALLVAALEQRYRLLASVPLMLEYEAVVTRPEHLEAAKISSVDAAVLLDAIARIVEPIRISFLWRPMLPDPGDDLVLETAVNGRAEALVTFNRRDFAPAAARFGLEILAPGDAVRQLENPS
jgi:predicted nucleic acid-binding protein